MAWFFLSALLATPGVAQDAAPDGIDDDRPLMVFFDWNSADLTRDAAAILDNAVVAYREAGMVRVLLTGHSDKSGSAGGGIAMAQRRGTAVRAYLSGHGIPERAISISALGDSAPLVETADGVREPQNRRVEIRFSKGSIN